MNPHEDMCPIMETVGCYTVGGYDKHHDRGSPGNCRCGMRCECGLIRRVQAKERESWWGAREYDGSGDGCQCWECRNERASKMTQLDAVKYMGSQMISCELCGNKRCPHGTNHTLDCTGSNAPGQEGSRYAVWG